MITPQHLFTADDEIDLDKLFDNVEEIIKEDDNIPPINMESISSDEVPNSDGKDLEPIQQQTPQHEKPANVVAVRHPPTLSGGQQSYYNKQRRFLQLVQTLF